MSIVVATLSPVSGPLEFDAVLPPSSWGLQAPADGGVIDGVVARECGFFRRWHATKRTGHAFDTAAIARSSRPALIRAGKQHRRHPYRRQQRRVESLHGHNRPASPPQCCHTVPRTVGLRRPLIGASQRSRHQFWNQSRFRMRAIMRNGCAAEIIGHATDDNAPQSGRWVCAVRHK